MYGGFIEWLKFSECIRLCGVGFKNRIRYCINLVFMYGGKDCIGKLIEIKLCNVDLCFVDGNYFLWLKFSICIRMCVNGIMIRM